jgi:hypothetical protein
MLFFLLFAFLAFMPKGKNGYSKRNYFFQLEVIILGKLKEIITINIGYRVLTGRRRKAEKSMLFSKVEGFKLFRRPKRFGFMQDKCSLAGISNSL